MATSIKDPITGVLLEVTAQRQIKIKPSNPTEIDGTEHPNEVGSIRLHAECDSGTTTGTPLLKALEASNDYRLRVGVDNMSFNEIFPGTALNSALWNAPTTTMTVAVASGLASLNAGNSLASGAVAQLRSYRHFPCYKSYTTYFEQEIQFISLPIIGNVCEWGAGIASGTATPTDGMFFRLKTTGEFKAVMNNNGTETESDSLDFSALVNINNAKAFLIYGCSSKILFWIDDILVCTLDSPAGQGSSTSSMNLPIFFRTYNTATTATAQQMRISAVNVTPADQSTGKLWNHILCGAGGHASQGQTGGAMGTTALYSNSLAVAAGIAMTNTTAALGSGLGGQFSALPTLAVGTDGIVSSFQVPLGTSVIPGKTLYVNSIIISPVVTTVLAGNATPLIYAFSLAYGHTSVSLQTTETATSKAPRRKVLGTSTFAAAAALGTKGDLNIQYNNPVAVFPGEFIQIVAKNIGAVTTTGVITFLIDIDGYME